MYLKIFTFIATKLLLHFIILFSLGTASTSVVNAQDKMIFATHTNPPLSLYLTEVLQTALEPYNITVQMELLPGERVISQVNAGFYDGDPCRVINFKSLSKNNTSNYNIVSQPIVSTRLVVVTLKTTKLQSISWKEVNTGLVAFKRGSKRLQKNILEQNKVPLTDSRSAIKMVAVGRVKSAIMFKSVADNLLKNNKELREKVTIHNKAIMEYNQYTYLYNKKFVPILKQALQHMDEKGILEKLAKKYNISPPLSSIN